MKKLTLDWNEVAVESFATTGEPGDGLELGALSGPLCGTLATRLTCCPCTPRGDEL